jgi:hypothetical protein
MKSSVSTSWPLSTSGHQGGRLPLGYHMADMYVAGLDISSHATRHRRAFDSVLKM